MSWFGMGSLKDLTSKVNMDKIKDFTEKAKQHLPKIENELLQNLTLTSPELSAERQRIDREERHKEAVKDMLAGIMPWETRDPERDILVEECKEAILKLSKDKATFFGPYIMPRSNVKLEDDDEEKPKSSEDGEDDLNENESKEEDTEAMDLKPSSSSLEKLEKLEPLPVLLRDFDLDSHVGLIKKLLKADPQLVYMQSTYSGGGEREKIFWQNYFFHCAFTRYEAGLSIDEIWSDQALTQQQQQGAENVATSKAAVANPVDDDEHEITFDKSESKEEEPKMAFEKLEVGEKLGADPASGGGDKEAGGSNSALSDAGAEFELVGEEQGPDVAGADDEVADYELDELEAEIARELED